MVTRTRPWCLVVDLWWMLRKLVGDAWGLLSVVHCICGAGWKASVVPLSAVGLTRVSKETISPCGIVE